ncbi:DNA translocase FtsK, partial [Geobacillus stearothermophilus]|nr:DNA translocase FtsK [Geobacillus stearothermophilus]
MKRPMKFWKRWLRMFAEEEEKEQPPIPQPERAEAKVVYQYPQGRFRFPLIPDDQPREEQKQPQRLVDGGRTRPASGRPSDSLARETAEKRPFRPSDVPSPVFGYQRQGG